MHRSFVLILIIFTSTISRSQTPAFETALNNLYFGVNLANPSASLLDSFLLVSDLKHNDTVIIQSGLGISIQLNAGEGSSSMHHTFTFTKSPLANFKIKTGTIIIKLGDNGKTKQLMDLQWYVDFDNKQDALLYFKKLKEIFGPLSTKQKTSFEKYVGHMAQYSTRKTGDTGIKDISIVLEDSIKPQNHRVSILLINEFVNQ